MGVIRYKIWYDLWANKARTLQVVLIIGMGAFAIGMIIGTRNLVVDGMEGIWRASSPASIALGTAPRVDDSTIFALRRIEGVADVEGVATATIEWRAQPGGDWLPAQLTARRDYEDQRYATLELLGGEWPADDGVALGQGVDTVYGAGMGDVIQLRIDGRAKPLKVTGMISDPVAQPPSFGGNAQLFVSRDTFGDLTGTVDYNRILAHVAPYSPERALAVAVAMQDKLEKQNVDSGGAMLPQGTRTGDPYKHFFQDIMDAIFMVLGVMAFLSLLLGLFLVYNTVNAIISQQVDQIGIMKAIGASTGQILGTYLLYVLAFGVLALLVAVPLGILGSWALNVFLLTSFNAEPGPLEISWTAIMIQVLIALVTPLLVAMVPVISGARVTVREAISTYGLSRGPSLLDRTLTKLKHVSRLILLTVSNTFRHKGRVVLTQITLVLSGLIFMMVMGVQDSTAYTFNDVLFRILNSNVNFVLEEAERFERVEALTRSHPNVREVEMWALANGSVRARGEPESDDDKRMVMFGVPPDSTLYVEQMRQGRWLLPEDGPAIVLNQKVAEDLGVAVGGWVTINEGLRGDSDWQVVGLLFDPLITNSVHVPREVLLRVQHSVGRANSVWVQTVRDDAATEARVADELRQLYEDNQIDVQPGGVLSGQDTSSKVVEVFNTQFNSIVVLLAVMAVVIGAVGSIALSGVLSLNVIERRREIGVMRAIGAPNWDIGRLFVGEGLLLGWLSWIIALPLSVPAGRIMTEALSAALGFEMVYHYTLRGALLWLVIITVLAALASWLPARRATQISVRESLAYQ